MVLSYANQIDLLSILNVGVVSIDAESSYTSTDLLSINFGFQAKYCCSKVLNSVAWNYFSIRFGSLAKLILCLYVKESRSFILIYVLLIQIK